MSLAAERARAAERRWQERVERTARAALNGAGWSAGLKEVEAFIRGRWPKLDDGQVEEVLARAGTMREERTNEARRLTPEEIENVATKRTEDTLKLIREVLMSEPHLTAQQVWQRIQRPGVKLCAKSSVLGIHVGAVRKELGIDPRRTMAKAAREQPRPKKQQKRTKPAPVGRPAGEAAWVTNETARQPSEEVSPPKDNAPPPAAPVADNTWVEPQKGGAGVSATRRVQVPAGIDQVRHAIEAELLATEQKVRELKIALDVLGRYAA